MSVEAATWTDDLTARTKPVAAAASAGLLAGVGIGGIGGRLAMFVLRLTSDPALRGLKTDDEFTIGIFSRDTLFLLLATAFLGVVGGLVYLVVRLWLPEGARPWLFGGLAGIVGGALVIRPGGLDFTLLDPMSLAVAMFVALPAAYGVAVSLLTERFLAPASGFGRWAIWMGGIPALLPLVALGPFGVALLALIALAVLLGRAAPGIGSMWTSPPVGWIGRAALVAIVIMMGSELVRDVIEVL
jgi:hypothetical protein